jgi:hypothetical protein
MQVLDIEKMAAVCGGDAKPVSTFNFPGHLDSGESTVLGKMTSAAKLASDLDEQIAWNSIWNLAYELYMQD